MKDLVRAVETHAVDAQENPLTNTVHFGLHKTHKHLSLTSHFHGVALLLANRAWLEALPASTQSAVLAACAEATAAQRQLAIAEDELCLEQLDATASPSCPRRRSTSPPSARRWRIVGAIGEAVLRRCTRGSAQYGCRLLRPTSRYIAPIHGRL